MPDTLSRTFAALADATRRDMLARLTERLKLSARAYDKVLRVARTLADLRGAEGVGDMDIAGSLAYRRMDDESKESFWA